MTSIEWLIEQLENPHLFKNIKWEDVKIQAKQMHKQEIIDAYEQGSDDEIVAYDGTRKYKHGLEYYTYTFVSKGSDDTPMERKLLKSGFVDVVPKQEISDEEIEVMLFHHSNEYAYGFKDAIKWYREQLKQRQ
jgi:hypothetical protein